jgi:hypothetical protein
VAIIVIAYKKSATFRGIVQGLGRRSFERRGQCQGIRHQGPRVPQAATPGKIAGIFGNAKNLLFNAGWNIVDGLWRGVSAIWNNFVGWFSGAMSWIGDKARSILGIASPSKVFKDIGGQIGMGIALGIEGSQDAVTSATNNLVSIPSVSASWLRAQGSGLRWRCRPKGRHRR